MNAIRDLLRGRPAQAPPVQAQAPPPFTPVQAQAPPPFTPVQAPPPFTPIGAPPPFTPIPAPMEAPPPFTPVPAPMETQPPFTSIPAPMETQPPFTMETPPAEEDDARSMYDDDARTVDATPPDIERRQLDFSEIEGSTLDGRDDPMLHPKFTMTIRKPSNPPAVPREPVFDIVGQQDVPIEEFLLQDPGNHVVFRYAGKQYGIPLMPILETIKEGQGIFYECTREFAMDDGQYGTFEPEDIYSQPYVEIALASRFYIPFETFQQIANIPTHVLWEITATDKVLKHAASRSSVLAGGPVMSQLHCQAGSDLTVFTMTPFTLAPAGSTGAPEEEEEEEPEETFVNIKMGEDKIPIDITDGSTYEAVRAKYAAMKGLNPENIQFIFGAGPVRDYSKNVMPGATILARQVGGGRRRTYRGNKKHGPRKTKSRK